MFREYLTFCGACKTNSPNCITLDCRHAMCLKCVAGLLLRNEASEMLTDEIEVDCCECTYVTLLSIPLAYKLTRSVNLRNLQEGSQTGKITMFCMQCLQPPFTIEQYLGGRHKAHKAKTIDQATTILTNILTYAAKDLQQSLDNLYREEEKLQHCVSLMNDVISANISRIKLGFDQLRSEINKREEETILAYRIAVEKQFQVVEVDLQDLHKTIEKGKEQLEWIVERVINRDDKEWNYHDKISLTTYFADNFASFSTPHQLEQLIKQKIPSHMQLVRINRQTVSIDAAKPIVDSIRHLQFIEQQDADQNSTEASSTLSRSYFETKKKQILGEQAITYTPHTLHGSLLDKKRAADKTIKNRRHLDLRDDSAVLPKRKLH